MEKEKIKKLVENSGIITHHKVINSLRKKDWDVLISPYYYDNISNRISEIDVIAEKQFNSCPNGFSPSVQINVQLFLECKYIKQEILFWFDSKDKDSAASKIENDTGLTILHNRMSADILPEKFHYLKSDKVAKLFSSNANRDDIIYKAMSQSLNAKIYYDQWLNKPIIKEFVSSDKNKTKILKYPIIVCDNFGKLIEIELHGDKYEHKEIKDHFQLELNYTYLDKSRTRAKTDYFLIDIVDFNYIDSFLNEMEKEANALIDPYIDKNE